MSGKTIIYLMRGEVKKLALQDFRLWGKRKTGMTLIDRRPAREVPGHWEGDLIIGKDHKSAILVTEELKSRFVQMDVLESMDARTV
jgi:IS30 family transposase